MTTTTERALPTESIDTANQDTARKVTSLLAKAGYFLLHFVEMCLVMCATAVFVDFAFFSAVALIGYPDLRHQFPELALLIVAFIFALVMAAWMWIRGMAGRPNLEMAGATLGLGIVLIGMYWLGIVTTSTLIEMQLMFCGPACGVMLVVMLFRLNLYTEGMRHHAHAA